MAICPVDCTCHSSPYAPCSAPGGCGSAGCTLAGCAVCRRRPRDTGQVCDPCRRWLPNALRAVPELASRARDELVPADDSTSHAVLVCRTCGLTAPAGAVPHHPGRPEYDRSPTRHAGWVRRRVIGHAGGPVRSVASDTIVTGGDGEASAPIDLHLHDLLAPVVRDGGRPIDATGDNWVQALDTQPRTVWVDNGSKGKRRTTVLDRRPRRDTAGHRVMVPAGDQIGDVPIAQVLDQEVRAWIDAGAPGGSFRPTPSIDGLVDWLITRLDWACDWYAGIDVFTDAVRQIRGRMMAALGDLDPEPERCEGVACSRCDLRMLFRRQDGSGDVECQNPDCLRVFTAVEYRELVAARAADERGRRDPQEVAALMRRSR
ncbi:hypothetical protein [Salinispora arenicola]|uniref:hypothetical protein n=1 Tax=Salinispora arenicola TaxID=168697 RepID=UPI0016B594BA|nr:hypothetical protein [Salinispora arenicola]NIL62711.1 hypothetical protein [Salinispora arenicola]